MNHQEKQGADLESVLLKAILKFVCNKSKKLKYSVSTSSEFKKKNSTFIENVQKFKFLIYFFFIEQLTPTYFIKFLKRKT